MPQIRLYPYNLGSRSARLLTDALEVMGSTTLRVRPNGNYHPRMHHNIVNWGSSTIPTWATPAVMGRLWNKPQNVAIAADKVATFQRLSNIDGVRVPRWTTDRSVAQSWFAQTFFPGLRKAVVIRKLTRAAEGRGIEIATTPEEVVAAPLYTLYTPKAREYRVHASAHHGVIDVQQKRKRNGWEANATNQYVRNHDGGWVFCHEGVELPSGAEMMAQQAVAALGLEFGAVDMGWHPDVGLCVYEINTAPGIEGLTVQRYAEFFNRVFA